MSSAKTSKALLSRVRKTKSGKILVTGKGQGHFNAKHSRSKKLQQKKQRTLAMSEKMRQRYILS